MGIGSKLTKLMQDKHTNANELSRVSGVPAQTIYSLIRRDASKVDIDSLIKIARALGVSAEYFCNEEIPENTKSIDDDNISYERMEHLLARNGKQMTTEQKMRLIKLLSEIE